MRPDALATAKTESPDDLRRRISEERRRKKLDEHRRVAALSAPLRDPAVVLALAKVENKLLDCRAEAESLRILDPKRHRKAIKRLENQERSLEAERLAILAKEQADNALYGEAKEPILRAIARGEHVEAREVEIADFVKDKHGARVIHRDGDNRGLPLLKYSRATRAQRLTGIERAYADGRLDAPHGPDLAEALLATGQSYCAAYLVTNNLLTPGGDGGGGGYGPKGPQIKLVEASNTLMIMRRGLSLKQIGVLDRVCGQEMSVYQASVAMRAGSPSVSRTLREGLRLAMKNVALARATG